MPEPTQKNTINGIINMANGVVNTKRKVKVHVLADPESDPSLSDSSFIQSDFLADINYSK